MFTKGVYTVLLCLMACVTGVFIHAETEVKDAEAGGKVAARRIEVLFLGSRNGSHRPLERFRTIRRAHGVKGINYTYANEPTALTKENLAKYDALMIYGNHNVITKDQETALLDYSSGGGACVFLHSACGCFRNSEPYIKLVGAQFKSHGKGVFRTKIVEPDHPVMKGFPGFECWDETYVHKKHNEDRVVLQKREDEPWTWVRTNGKGRVFYTASGHDDRCWSLAEYQDLVYRGLMWTLNEKAALVKNLDLPKLEYYTSEVNILPGKGWGKPLDRKIPHSQFQKALSVEDSMKLVQVPAGMELQLFASEPMVVNPIAMSWDDRGRMWVVEANDYPNSFVMNSPGQDKVKILEDTDGDGKADKVTVFADGLTIATSVLAIDGGCITTDNGEMVFLSDSDGDGVSDKRFRIFGGISLSDTHATVSNLRLGFDGWIYATVGYSGVKVDLGGEVVRLKQGVFRFKRDGSAFEVVQSTTNNTWGLGFNEEGRLMGSTANNNASFYVGMALRHYRDAGVKGERTPRADRKNFIYPLTFDYLQVDQKERFTAAAGHSFYTARLFGSEWWNRRVFICSPTGKLVSAATVRRDGAGFKTTNTEQNIYASADAWSAPVAAEVGPDGAVYVADWYNSVVQHNVYAKGQDRGKGNAYITKHRDRLHGRIYRIIPRGAEVKAFPKLGSVDEQLAALGNDNLFWRQQAQYLLVKGGEGSVAGLKKLLSGSGVSADARRHAHYALGQLGVDMGDLSGGAASASVIYNSDPTAENAIKWLRWLEGYGVDEQLAVLLLVCDVPRDAEILATLREKRVLLAERLAGDGYLSHVMDIAILNHAEKKEAKVVVKRKPLSVSAMRGKAIYKKTCVACHQPDGAGSPGVFPPLSGSDWLARNPKHAVMVVTHGLTGPVTVSGKEYKGVMPAHASLGDGEVADVLNYVRNAFQEQLGDIKVDLVKEVREKYKERKEPFTEEDILSEK